MGKLPINTKYVLKIKKASDKNPVDYPAEAGVHRATHSPNHNWRDFERTYHSKGPDSEEKAKKWIKDNS